LVLGRNFLLHTFETVGYQRFPLYASNLCGATNNNEALAILKPFAWLPTVLCRSEVEQIPTDKKKGHMTKKAMIAGAAIAGLMSGSFAVTAHAVQSSSKAGVSLEMGKNKADADKHACKGKNSCKGKGGCKTDANSCKGTNSCKGKGGCATDGSKPAESPAK
jgi:hypothetical protein